MIISFLLSNYRRDKPVNTDIELMLIEEKKFRSFARRRIKEGKIAKISQFNFQYIQVERRAELVEEMVFIGLARKYLEEGKFTLIHDFEFKHIPLKRRDELLQEYGPKSVSLTGQE